MKCFIEGVDRLCMVFLDALSRHNGGKLKFSTCSNGYNVNSGLDYKDEARHGNS